MIPGKQTAGKEKTMNHHFASQLIADRQAALAADATRRAQVREALATRKAAASAGRPGRIRRLSFGRPAPASA